MQYEVMGQHGTMASMDCASGLSAAAFCGVVQQVEAFVQQVQGDSELQVDSSIRQMSVILRF